MRVTQTMLANNTLRHISKGYENLGRLQDQLASGKKITRAHQDPVVAMKGMRYRTDLTEVIQFQRNISEVYTWMDNADSAMDKVGQALHRIRELVVQASNDTYESTQRGNMAKEIKQLTEHIASLANTKVNGKYIFNGTNTTTQPVNLAGASIEIDQFNEAQADTYMIHHNGKRYTYDPAQEAFVNGDEKIMITQEDQLAEDGEVIGTVWNVTLTKGEDDPVNLTHDDVVLSRANALSVNQEDVTIEVMKGINMPVNIRPQNVFSPELFKDLNDLVKKLETGTTKPEEISEFLGKVDKYMDKIVSERAELGARVNRMEMIEQRVMEQRVIANRILSENEDADMEEVIINLTIQESVHRAALAAGARIIQPTLMDFLR